MIGMNYFTLNLVYWVMMNKGYIFWRDYFREPSIYELIRDSRLSRYNLYYRYRVYDYNMIYGLTEGKFKNSYSKIKYTREYKRNENEV